MDFTPLPAFEIILFWMTLGYLAGSIPFGLVLTRLSGYGDIREIGSGNIGSTNVLRTGNKRLALGTLLLDASKAFLVVAAAQQFMSTDISYVVGTSAFIGHTHPVWLNFKGGKGVATYIGVVLAGEPFAGLAFIFIWLGMASLSRISSLSALIACVIIPFFILWLDNNPLALISTLLSCIVFWTHRANISRLIKGHEPKINQK